MAARKKASKRGASSKGRKARSREHEEELEDEGFSLPLGTETLRGVWAIIAIVVAVFFVLAGFGFAGMLGTTLYIWLSALFGVGYVLVPVSFVLLAFVLFASAKRESVGALHIAGTVVFFLAGLGFIEALFDGRGGLVGQLVSSPLLYAIDTIATVIALLALTVVSLMIAFDADPQRAFPTVIRFVRREKKDDAETYEEVLDTDEAAALDSQVAELEEAAEEAPAHEAQTPADAEPSQHSDEDEKERGGLFTFGGSGTPMTFGLGSSGSSEYTPPPLSLLQKDRGRPSVGDVKASANTIKRTLQNFGISVEMDEVSIGPTVTQYAMKPAEGVRLAKIVSLQSNLELALAATPIRIEAPIPGKSLVGIEVPNSTKSTLGLGSVLADADFQKSDKPLLVALGRDIAGNPHYANIAKMPHLLIAGATGAGKSVTVHDLIVSLLYRKGPHELRLVMVDPKRVELTLYNDIPHLLTPVITDPKKAILALKWLAKEMDRRYDVLEAEKVRDIGSYHKNVLEPALKKKTGNEGEELPEPMPYIVAIIDEMADLMTAYPRELEAAIVRLAQMSRAVGIHLVLSTQRPSVQVITGLIKANIPARLALQVSSQIDSRTILDMGGAEKLLGAGDMLFLSGEMSKPRRIQAPYVSEEEVKKVVKHLQKAYIDELPDEIDLTDVTHDSSIFAVSLNDDESDEEDDLYEDARRVIIEAGKGSTSFLQRKLRIGYARAARLMDMLEERGVVGPADGSKPREVIDKGDDALEEAEEVWSDAEDRDESDTTDEADDEDAEFDEDEEDDERDTRAQR